MLVLVSSALGRSEEQVGPCQPAISRAVGHGAVLICGLEHVVLETDQFYANIKRVLAADEVDIVVPLIIIGSDLGGAVPRVPARRVAREGHHGQSVGEPIASHLYARDAELSGKLQSRIPILRKDEES